MFGKVKKVFFTGVFGILYVSFIAQLAYVLFATDTVSQTLIGLAALSLEWLVLIAAVAVELSTKTGTVRFGDTTKSRKGKINFFLVFFNIINSVKNSRAIKSNFLY